MRTYYFMFLNNFRFMTSTFNMFEKHHESKSNKKKKLFIYEYIPIFFFYSNEDKIKIKKHVFSMGIIDIEIEIYR